MRIEKRLGGTNGCAARHCQATNASSVTTPATSDVATRGSAHPWFLDSMRAYTVPASPTADKAAPATSRWAWRVGLESGDGTGRNQNVNAKPMTIGTADRA